MTPDGARYMLAAQGVRPPRPFCYRWLLPTILDTRPLLWIVAQWGSLAGLAGLLWVETGAWWTVLLVAGLSGLTVNVRHPVLVDLPALTLAFGAAVYWRHGWWPAAVLLVLLAGACKESAPVFAAVYAWNPILLVGLLAVPWWRRGGIDPCPPGSPAAVALERPVWSSWVHHRPLPVWVYVLPWGVLLVALTNGDARLWVCVALAYGQMFVATDTVRLYQWAAPAVVLAAVPVLDGPWLPVLLLLHLANPFRTEGF